MANTYYIDGYNVLHKSATLRNLLDLDLETARERFIDKIADFCITSGTRVILVFDGMGAQRVETVEHHRSAPGLDVRYAPSHLSADAVIEREVYNERDRLEVIVVTSDQGIRDLVRGMGALTMEPAHFLTNITESGRDVSDALQRTQRNAPEFLEDRLGDAVLDKLRDLKKRL